MPIHAPGRRKARYSGVSIVSKREIVAVLQLTAMVDMFTVLVVFLLQNYASTDQILPIEERIKLPQAEEVRSLKPSHVVVIFDGQVLLNTEPLGRLSDYTNSQNWTFSPLKTRIVRLLKEAHSQDRAFLMSQLKQINESIKTEDYVKDTFFRVTIQADESTQFADVKKVMYTLTEAGIKEMNFAVVKKTDSQSL